jgi:phosphatidylserine/phosphatidylglycerophosphate/cardiolipin synthase-like enzyme
MDEKQSMRSLLCMVAVLCGLLIWGCQLDEPLEPPYEDLSIVVVNDRDYVPFLLSSINEAEEYIHIVMYLMKYYPQDTTGGVSQLQKALIEAAEKDVEVRVILEWSDYNSSLNATNESTFVYLDAMGLEVRFDPSSVTTHAKLVIIDGRIAYVGSSNWSKSAFEDNNEVNARIEDKHAVGGMESYFRELWTLSHHR